MNIAFWGLTTKRVGKFLVFHDESEPKANKGWLLIGLLFVNSQILSSVTERLRYHRIKENYWNEIHFCELPKSFEGEFSAKARVAKQWLHAYQDGLFNDALFSCLAVNRASPKFDHGRFREHYHAYNRFTAMAIKAGISFLLAPLNYDEIEITIISDGKNRKTKPEQNVVDNFEDYIPYRVELDNELSRWNVRSLPKVRVKPILVANSNQCDLLQLTDLLLGATQAALTGIAQRPTKRKLGQMVSQWYQDLQKPPWEQTYKMYRKLNLWGFPDNKGAPFNKFQFQLINNGQLSLF